MNPQQPPVTPNPESAPPQPVAYDAQGRPLYAHPPVSPSPSVAPSAPPQPTPAVVHMSRAIDPVAPEVSAEVAAKHQDSVRRYPYLNLSEGEYVVNSVRRHPIGLLAPVGLSAFLVMVTAVGLGAYPELAKNTGLPGVSEVILPAVMLMILFIIGGYAVVWVYLQNKFFLTNESVIQEIQTSLFAKHEQTVSLGSIEDASFRQNGILQSMLNYGSIRLSTEGEETTYRFYYVSNPKQQIAVLNNAVENFKNGRPVTGL
ncbi:hypothetical protein I8H84_04475 [Candidatus Saccharibacteria bacterium]|nr:hypothetical protein [Candidatus Saccharibacteria bacterium]MBH1973408.1 hypothetical protein [Candidatus Saccharibacteria bacterium]MBH1990351.1 hypothetical protein [Candidatus Saccharibacteria bacterium]